MTRPDRIARRFQARIAESWWWRRFADLVDREQSDGTYRPFDYNAHRFVMNEKNNRRMVNGQLAIKQPYKIKPISDVPTPPMKVDRPEDMTRQTQRRLYREACKVSGVPFAPVRKEKTPRRLRGMTPVQRALWEEKQWQEYKEQYVHFITDEEAVSMGLIPAPQENP